VAAAVDMDDQISEADGGNKYLVNGTLMPMDAAAARAPIAPAAAGATT
jgi:hypothetical protein